MFKGILTSTILILSSTSAFAGVKTICGYEDDRVPSYEAEVGRLFSGNDHAGCTATMISDSCAITAGHCVPGLDRIEFNTPASSSGKPVASKAEDIYEIDTTTIVSKDNGMGHDWGVFKVKRNRLTGKFPGQAQGYLEVSYETPKVRDVLKITGYGADQWDATRNFAQQTNTGEVESIGTYTSRSALQHSVDTMGGNSGSSIIQQSTGKIIGIHTHGGCHQGGGANAGTLVSLNYKLKNAILKCLGKRY